MRSQINLNNAGTVFDWYSFSITPIFNAGKSNLNFESYASYAGRHVGLEGRAKIRSIIYPCHAALGRMMGLDMDTRWETIPPPGRRINHRNRDGRPTQELAGTDPRTEFA